VSVVWHGIRDSLLMGWQIWWALVCGFFVSGVIQAWVPRERVQQALSGRGVRSVSLATGLGAASSSCSYAAAAISKSLFQRGASAAASLAFQFASTNLVWELGFVLWVLHCCRVRRRTGDGRGRGARRPRADPASPGGPSP
jgi:uncharacterized membrane protein YraQ (UPF0718 family)